MHYGTVVLFSVVLVVCLLQMAAALHEQQQQEQQRKERERVCVRYSAHTTHASTCVRSVYERTSI